MVLRKAKDFLGNGVKQHFVRSARDAAGGGVNPARLPIVLDGEMLIKMQAIRALQVNGQFGQFLAGADRYQLVERAFRPGSIPACIISIARAVMASRPLRIA